MDIKTKVTLSVFLIMIGGYFVSRSKSIDAMARTMWGEARGEGVEGMRAVGHVINNRASIGGWWGNTILEVVFKPWQFSAWNKNDPNLELMNQVDETDPVFAVAKQLATNIVDGVDQEDPTGGATHYHTTAVSPTWSNTGTVTHQHGNHIFYTGVA